MMMNDKDGHSYERWAPPLRVEIIIVKGTYVENDLKDSLYIFFKCCSESLAWLAHLTWRDPI